MYPLRFGTDCSGADAPLFALKQVLEELKCNGEHDEHELVYEFGSDIILLCRRILMAGTPAPRVVYEDLTTRDHSKACRVHLYVAGFPCQSFSNLGLRKGLDDLRGNVFFGILEYLKCQRPAIFVLENVRGLLHHDGGKTWTTILAALESIGNYVIHHKCISPHEIGSPQTRARLFIVGKCQRQLGINANTPMQWPLSRPLHANALEDLLQDDDDVMATEPSVFRKLTPKMQSNLDMLAKNARHRTSDLSGHACYLGVSTGRERLGTYGVVPCLRLRCDGVYFPGRGRFITSREALRVQGFPDHHPPIKCSFSQRMRLAGNAISVPVMVEILRPLVKMLMPLLATIDIG
jgi:DNA (cytosine-5)-methyltransferase 1